jgi:hypothetical protein
MVLPRAAPGQWFVAYGKKATGTNQVAVPNWMNRWPGQPGADASFHVFLRCLLLQVTIGAPIVEHAVGVCGAAEAFRAHQELSRRRDCGFSHGDFDRCVTGHRS